MPISVYCFCQPCLYAGDHPSCLLPPPSAGHIAPSPSDLTLAQHAAVSSPFVKRKPVAELLVRRGAALNEKNKELLTPLHVATDCNHADSVELLLKHGAKVNALDSHGQTGQWAE